MIQAKVTKVVPRRDRPGPYAFAESRALASPENPEGSVMFYVSPPHWTHGRPPVPGQSIVLGQISRMKAPKWETPRWRASDVSPHYATANYSPGRLEEATKINAASLWDRALYLLGLKERSPASTFR